MSVQWREADPDERHWTELVAACRCEKLDEFDLTIAEGSIILTHPECGEPVDLDSIGWFWEAPLMDTPVRVKVEFVVESGGYYDPTPEPAYIELTPVTEAPLAGDLEEDM